MESNFTQLLALISRYCPRLQHWLEDKDKRAYKVTCTCPQSQNEFEFLGLLGDEIRNKTIEEINSADAFTIMADTTPDTSHKDQMSVITRYVNDNGVVCERLVDLKEVRDKTGAGQAAAVIASVDQNGMDKDRIAFQSYDFTNRMPGERNGAQAIVPQTLGRRVPYIPCQAHRSNTINEHACGASPIVSELFDTLQTVYAFFVGSTKRFYSLLHDELEKIENALALRNLSATRWTARAESLKAMWVSYDGVLDVLRKIECSSSVDAKGKALATGLLAKLLRVDFVVLLMLMRLVLWKTKVLTEVLQGENLNIIDALVLNTIKATITSLEVIRGDDVGIGNQIEAFNSCTIR